MASSFSRYTPSGLSRQVSRMSFPILAVGLALTGCTSLVNVPNLHYFTPKKEVTASVTYTFTIRKDYKKYVAAKKDSKGNVISAAKAAELVHAFITEITIANPSDVVIQTRLVPDQQRKLQLPSSFFKGKAKLDVAFDENAPGFIKSINTDQTPATAEIIEGASNLLGGVLSLAGTAFGLSKVTPSPVDSIVFQTTKVTRQIDITSFFGTAASNTNIAFTPGELADAACKLSLLPNSCISTKQPVLHITTTPYTVTQNPTLTHLATNPPPASDTKLAYRLPSFYNLSITLTNNGLTPEQQIIETTLNLPQMGGWETIAVGDASQWRGRRNITVKFDNTAGTLAQYTVETESMISNTLTKSGAALEKTGTGIKGLQDVRINRLKQETERLSAEAALLKAQKELNDLQNPAAP